jgi:hypothetical protein
MLSKKSNAESITIPDIKLYNRTIAIKTAWYWHKNRYEDQLNKTEDPNMIPYRYTHLIFGKGVKIIQCRKDSLFNKCWENWISSCKKLKLDPCLIHVLYKYQLKVH